MAFTASRARPGQTRTALRSGRNMLETHTGTPMGTVRVDGIRYLVLAHDGRVSALRLWP